MATIGLLGDVMLGRGVGAELEHGSPQEVWEPGLRELCSGLDLVVCNLELLPTSAESRLDATWAPRVTRAGQGASGTALVIWTTSPQKVTA